MNASNHKKLDIDVNSDFIDGQVLYLGKTEESLFDRLTEHINGDDSKRTYSLKLSDNNRKSLKSKIKILVFKLNEDYEKYAKTVLSSIESRLHDELHPRVGSKR